MIDYRIDTFIAVCRYMNYTRAAAELNITQPAVSQHIRYLENLYNTRLFSYQNKKISVTESGKMLLEAARTMKHDEQYLKEAIAELGKTAPGIHFGVTLTVGEYCISAKVAEYIKRNPGTQVKIAVHNTQELLHCLNEGEIDFAIVEGNFAKNEYDCELYSRQELIPVCAYTHKFNKKPELLEDILSQPLILREEKSGGREILERSLKGKNLTFTDFHSIIEVSSINTIKELAVLDCGITFLYEAAVREELKQKKLKRILLEDFSIWHDITFIWLKNSIYSERYRELYRALKPDKP